MPEIEVRVRGSGDHYRIVMFGKTNYEDFCEIWRYRDQSISTGKKAAAARSTGLRPYPLQQPRNSRDVSFFERKHYRLVMIGKPNFSGLPKGSPTADAVVP
jgi:hypothetical protein